MKSMNILNCIFIIKKLSTKTQKFIKECNKLFSIEIFYEYELILNPVKHYLVPDHALLNIIEKKKLIANYGLKESQFPKILVKILKIGKRSYCPILWQFQRAGF